MKNVEIHGHQFEQRAFGVFVCHELKQIYLPNNSVMRFLLEHISWNYAHANIRFIELLALVSPELAEGDIEQYEVVYKPYSAQHFSELLPQANAAIQAFGREGFSDFLFRLEERAKRSSQ